MKRIVEIENIEASDIFSILERIEDKLNKILEAKTNSSINYMTRKEVSKRLGISLVTLNDWTKKGLIPAYKCGNRVYYDEHEILQAIKLKTNKLKNLNK